MGGGGGADGGVGATCVGNALHPRPNATRGSAVQAAAKNTITTATGTKKRVTYVPKKISPTVR